MRIEKERKKWQDLVEKRRTAFCLLWKLSVFLLFIGGLYVYGQIDSRLNKIETPQLDESKIVTNVTAPQMSGYTTYALFRNRPAFQECCA